MAKRKRSGKAGANGTPKRARVNGDDDRSSPAAAAAAAAVAEKVPTETDILLSDRSLFADDLSRADHDRERRLYQLLGSCDAEDRIRAGDVVIEALLGGEDDDEEKEEKKEEEKCVSETVLMRHLERRLLRGLATSNEASRVGFSYVLSEMLGRLFGRRGDGASSKYTRIYPNLTFDRVLDLLLDKTKPGSNVPGQEQRDHHWGRLFGLMSIVESGILFGPGDEKGREEEGHHRRVHRWDSVLEQLLQLGHRVVWLRAYAFYVIAQAILRGQLPDAATVASTLRAVAADTTSGGGGVSLAKTPEGLGVWLAALTRFPDMALPAPWTQPLAPASHKDVVAVLRSGGGSEDDESKTTLKQGNATPQLHFVWDLLLSELLSASARRFDGFWIAVVDQVYFAKGATDHQKLTGFKVFQKALALCAGGKGNIPPSLFSNNLMACLINQASNPTPRLHRAAVAVLRDIEFQVEQNPRALVPVLTGLLGAVPQAHGVYDFDERVKGTGDGTKPVEHILRFANGDNVEDVLGLLRSGAIQARDPKNDQRPIRIYAEYLFRLVSQPVGSGGDSDDSDEPQQQVSVSGTAFKALAELAYRPAEPEAGSKDGSSKKKNKKKTSLPAFPALTDKTQTSARQYLLSAAGAILKRPDDRAAFCRTVCGIDPEAVGVAMTGEIKYNVVASRQQLQSLMAAFASGTETTEKNEQRVSGRARQGLAVLLAVSLLQLYHEPRADAVEVLHDIKACGDKLVSGSAAVSAEKDGSDSDDDAEPDIGQVLTDVLLSLLAESSQLTRQTSLLVFEAFAPFMSAEALDNLADVLAAEENTSGYRALFNPDNGEEDEDDEDDSDLEMIDMEEREEEDDDDDDESDKEDSEADSDSDKDETTTKPVNADAKPKEAKSTKKTPAALNDDDGLEAALMKTYNSRVGGGSKKGNGNDDSDDSNDESDMDDDAMLALDSALASHMALIRDKSESHRKEREEARSRVVQFKHRVLDLLDVYVRAGAGNGSGIGSDNSVLLFRLFLPLAVLVRETKDKSLAAKATRVVQKLKLQLKRRRSSQALAATSSSSSSTANIDAGLAIVASLHEAANDRTENKAFAAAVSAASLAIASTLLWMATTGGVGDGDGDAGQKQESRRQLLSRIAAIYDATKAHCADDGWRVRKELFADYANWCQTTANVGGTGGTAGAAQ